MSCIETSNLHGTHNQISWPPCMLLSSKQFWDHLAKRVPWWTMAWAVHALLRSSAPCTVSTSS